MYLASRRLRREGEERHVHEETLDHVLLTLIEGEVVRAGCDVLLLLRLDLEGSKAVAPGREGNSIDIRMHRTTLPLTGAADMLPVSVGCLNRPPCRMAGQLAMSRAARSG